MNDLDNKVVVPVDIQESDLLRANFGFQYSKWSIKLTIGYPFLGLIYGFFVLPNVDYTNPASAAMGAAPLLFFVIFPILYPLMIWLQTKRGFSNLKDFQKNVQFVFSTDGYDINDEKSSGHLSWDSILSAVETKHSFNLFFHKVLFHVIPKRCIKEQEDIDGLRKILKQSLGDKAKIM
jgi:hypothetical protein